LSCQFHQGDSVAVLPARGALPEEVLEIATIHYVSRAFVQLTDGRLYAKHDGRCMGSGQGGYIVAVTKAHQLELARRAKEGANNFGNPQPKEHAAASSPRMNQISKADGEGFEPTVDFRPRRFSRPVP
jgi:hypothetical protein